MINKIKCMLTLAFIALIHAGHAQQKAKDQFILEGKVLNQDEGFVYLTYVNKKGERINDSCALKNGAFRFTGFISEPTMASFAGKTTSRSTDDPNFVSIFLEPANMKMEVSANKFKSANLTGSKTQLAYGELQRQIEKIRARWQVVMDTLSAANKRSNFEYQELRSWALRPYFAEMREINLAFFEKYPESYATAYRLRFMVNDLTTDSLKLFYDRFPEKLKQSEYGKHIAEALEKRKHGVVGSMAKNFSATDINGNKLTLSDFKGKYVLLDFWASWCLPCRKLNPHLKELYASYKDKGFEVIGVSDDDRNPQAWRKAVADDGLPWKHVLRGRLANGTPDPSNDVNEGFNISYLPTHILIDPSGKIIGRYGEDGESHTLLDKQLESIFGVRSVSASQQARNEFMLNGRIEGLNEGLLYLHYAGIEKRIKDSSMVKNGMFSFRGMVNEPTMAFLQLKEEKRNELNSASFFIEPGVINVSVTFNDFKNAKVSGSAVQMEYEALNKLKEPIRKEMQPAIDEYTAANQKYMEAVKNKLDEKTLEELKDKAYAIRAKFTPFTERERKVEYEFFRTHPTSPVTAYMLSFRVSDLPLDSLQMYYDRFGTALQQSSYGKEIADEIRKLRAGSPGSMAKNFSATDINGNKLSLSDYRGKYVLLDFWASWCVPCRKGNPHLKELYSKYKSKGIEFIGIADDDRAEEAWRKAVEKDGIGMWKHVRRGLKYQNGVFDRSTDISENFGIHTLPTKILIDPKGMIIGRYYEEEEPLDRKLREIFGE